MSRLFTTLLLYRQGYVIAKYISLESKIEKNEDSYYAALEKSEICRLDLFLKEAENYFSTTFQTEKPAYLSVSKGINKKIIKEWVKNRFVSFE